MSDAQSRDDERAARLAAQRKAWNDAHPTYYAEYRERNREEIRRKNREYMRDQAQRERDEKERRQKGIERAKAWAKEHPEERQQARERYKQKHPEAYKQAQRDYYHRNREAIAERRRAREAADPKKAKDARRRAVDRAREAGRDSAWSPTPDQRATYRERENEARRLARRRARAGLPERQLHRVHAPERRHNDAAADAFFAQKRTGEDVVRIRSQDEPTPPELVHALQRVLDPSAELPRRDDVVEPPTDGLIDATPFVAPPRVVLGEDGFIPGEEVAVAIIVRHTKASADGSARALLEPGICRVSADGEVILVGRISGTCLIAGLT